MDRIVPVRNARRFTNFVQSLLTSIPATTAAKQYVRVDNGNYGSLIGYIIIDKDDIQSAVVEGDAVTIVPWGSQEEDDKITGTILNPEILTAGLTPSADGRYEYNDTTTKTVLNSKDVAVVDVRPLGQGEHIADRRFVQLQFKGGGFLNVVAAAEEARKLEALVLESNAPVIEWKAGTHDIWIKREHLSGCEIDKHEPESETQLRSHATSDDQLKVRMVTSEGQTSDVLLSTPPIPGKGNFGPNGKFGNNGRFGRRNERSYDNDRNYYDRGNYGYNDRGPKNYRSDERWSNQRYS